MPRNEGPELAARAQAVAVANGSRGPSIMFRKPSMCLECSANVLLTKPKHV